MDYEPHSLAPIRSALFVDFDNIYIGLSKTDPFAAERFASDPARWLSWLEQGLPGIPRSSSFDGGIAQPGRHRSILIRRCYPNPDAGFRRYRSYFTSAAFTVVDCPSMTRTGKNSSDIYMVMDILDTLNHKTYFDEFIIFSGDSDFMPVLLRLRAHDRRTTTLAIDFMPPAFKAACDLVIDEEEFIEDALGVPQDGDGPGGSSYRARLHLPILKDMAQRVFECVREDGEVPGADLPDILKDFREFRESNNWLGFGTSHRLAEALVSQEQRLQLVRLNPIQYKLVLKPSIALDVENINQQEEPAEDLDVVTLTSEPCDDEELDTIAADAARRFSTSDTLSELKEHIVDAVQEIVTSSRSAVLLARASQLVVSKLGPQVLDSQWAGAGSFKKLLQSVDDLGLEITTQPEPGYIFDPKRHTHPARRLAGQPGNGTALNGPSVKKNFSGELSFSLPVEQSTGKEPVPEAEGEKYPVEEELPGSPYLEEVDDEYDNQDPDEGFDAPLPGKEDFARRVSQVTGAPLLTSEQYALVFQGIIRELQLIAEGEKTYNTYQSSKSVSDWCAEQGQTVSHSDIVLVFKGIIFQDGVRFGKRPGSYTVEEVANVVRDNIKALCQRSQLELSAYENRLLDAWIMGGLANTPRTKSVDDEKMEGVVP